MSDNRITVAGNLTKDPEISYTPSGVAVVNFDIAQTPRYQDGNEWKDGVTNYYHCTAWRTYAENLAESARKGTRVIVSGSLSTSNFVRRNGEEGTTTNNINADEVSLSLKFNYYEIPDSVKNRSRGNQNQGGGYNNRNQGGGYNNQGGGYNNRNQGSQNQGGGYNNRNQGGGYNDGFGSNDGNQNFRNDGFNQGNQTDGFGSDNGNDQPPF